MSHLSFSWPLYMSILYTSSLIFPYTGSSIMIYYTASLCSSAVVARAPLVIYPLKTRHHDATTATNHSATTSLSRCRRPPQPLPLPQPVCYHAADDHRNP